MGPVFYSHSNNHREKLSFVMIQYNTLLHDITLATDTLYIYKHMVKTNKKSLKLETILTRTLHEMLHSNCSTWAPGTLPHMPLAQNEADNANIWTTAINWQNFIVHKHKHTIS